MQGGQYLGWLAEQEGEVIGGAGLLLTPWQPGRHDPHPLRGRVVNVFVEPAFRRQGLARRLVEAVLEGAQAQGLRTLSLGASELGRPLYASLGFLPVTGEMLRTEPESG